MRRLAFILISTLLVLGFTFLPKENLKNKKQSYSCTVYVYNSYGSPAKYVKVTGYFSKSVWSSGSNTVTTDANGKAVLEWYSDKPLTFISVWDGSYNYGFEGTFEDGYTYRLKLDKSKIY